MSDRFTIRRAREFVGYIRGVPTKFKATEVAPDMWLETRAADSFRRMQSAALRDGHTLKVNSAFRSFDHQQRLWDRWHAWRDKWDGEGYRRPRPAPPGRSKHHCGVAVDIQRSHGDYDGDGINDIDEWLDTHAKHFGFYRTVRGEPWHWEHKRKTAQEI